MAVKREYLKRVTIENRIMLLLFDHQGRKDDYSVPEVLSQGGMSKEMDVRQNNISRTLQELYSKGLIASRSSHVTGRQRRRKVYYLTEKGSSHVDDLMDVLSGKLVLVKTKNGDMEEWTLDRFISYLSRQMSRKFSLYEVISYHLDGNEADLTLSGPTEGVPRQVIPSLPVVEDFYGRKEEMSLLEDLINAEGPEMMLVLGIAGQGKTTLVSHFLKDHFIKRFNWIPCNRWMRPLTFLNGCASHLKGFGADSLSRYLKLSSIVDHRRGAEEMVKDLSSSGTVLVLDDAHRINDEMSDFMRLLKEVLFTSGITAKIMLISRERPDFYTRTEIMMKERMMEIELGGLDRSSVGKLLKDVDIPDEEHDIIYSLTNGHPLALSLLKASPGLDPTDLKSSLDRFLDEEILSSLDRLERSVLELASVLEDPVRMDCFTSIKGVNTDNVNSLRKRMLLRDYSDGSMDLHDAVKDTVSSSLSPERLIHYQKIALRYYSKRSRDNDLLNYLQLCRELGRIDEAIGILSDYGEYLLGKGFPLVLETLGDLMEEDLERPTRVRMLLLVSEADRLSGDRDGSRSALREAAVLCEDLYQGDEAEGMVLMSRILSRLAELHLVEGKGMDTYERSLKLVKKAGIPKEEGKVLSNMGCAYMGIEEFELALDHLGRALNIFEGLGDHRGASICRLNMGEVYQQKGNLARALKEYLQTLKETSSQGLDRVQYQAMYRAGKLYMMVMQPLDARGYLRSSLSGYIAIGDLEYAEKVLVQFVSSSIKSESREGAVRTIKRSKRSLVRTDRLSSFFIGRTRTERSDQIIGWFSAFLGILEGGPIPADEISGILNEMGPRKALGMLREVSYSLSRDFKGPDSSFLNAILKQERVKGPLLLEAHVLLAFTYDKGSSMWKTELRKALKTARDHKLVDQIDRLRTILSSI
ncbi:MAG: tetratricopeptide repeat protein [Candidatus Thermoplasmatota archaeon]|nr:tetratricopeptide repeat protein [Candidatus Thermoplasmatota archaeon]